LSLNQQESGKTRLAKQLGHKTVSGELHKQVKRMLDWIFGAAPDNLKKEIRSAP